MRKARPWAGLGGGSEVTPLRQMLSGLNAGLAFSGFSPFCHLAPVRMHHTWKCRPQEGRARDRGPTGKTLARLPQSYTSKGI